MIKRKTCLIFFVFVQKQLIKIEFYKSLKIFISVDRGRTSAYLPRPGWPASESPRTRRESRSQASPGGRPSPAAPTAGRATTRREAFRRRRDKRWSRSCRSSRPSARRKTSACRSPDNNFHALGCCNFLGAYFFNFSLVILKAFNGGFI